ncbi:hypothetical protein HPC49_31170 [Pyxidicoccus fallax]|uniref:Uncharacterized protein n=1 Tax=Pyxidicoccus fallax TaxID=394095 RepID=A0A848L3W9_9BACT|nr:hypothetical protein [Pyxidicoccus fallax]NMO13640.1 hypothetical protein [Pyxidicoccus fallax]NPC82672.1 hypothetical protein [Pyxidicoccus fallax]
MGYAEGHVGFEGPVPSIELVRDRLAERLASPVDIIETPPGFWVWAMTFDGLTRRFSIFRCEQALETWPESDSPANRLLLRILTEFGGVLGLVNSPAPWEARFRFHFAGALPTPEQIEARLSRATGTPSPTPPHEFPITHELWAPMLHPKVEYSVTLWPEPHGIRLVMVGGGITLLREATAVLVSLGGRRLDDDEVQNGASRR